MLCSTDTCQNKVRADQYHETMFKAHRGHVFYADQELVWIAGAYPVNSPEKFSHPESHSKVSNLMITGLLHSHNYS